MFSLKSSLRARLSLAIAVFLALVVGLTSVSVVSLCLVDRKVATVNRRLAQEDQVVAQIGTRRQSFYSQADGTRSAENRPVGVGDRLRDDHAAAAEAADYIRRVIDRAIIWTFAICFISILLAVGLLVRVKTQVTRLWELRGALSRLAQGEREVCLPLLERGDELGDVAKAFDIFRINALALEEAHKAAQAAEERAQMLACYDSLTELPNRRAFTIALEKALEAARGGFANCSLLILDLDRFKEVNDVYGHPAGDGVLREVARRLASVVSPDDMAARLGGDEFAVIARGEAACRDGAARLAKRILAALQEPIALDGGLVHVGASVGIARCPTDAFDSDGLLRAADKAMYQAKNAGWCNFCFFEQSVPENIWLPSGGEMILTAAAS
jgi:diguanylate cyclase (GGDEF)-like protein